MFIGVPEILPFFELLTIIQKIVAPNILLKFGVRKLDGVIFNKEWFDIGILRDKYDFTPRYSLSEGIPELLLDLVE